MENNNFSISKTMQDKYYYMLLIISILDKLKSEGKDPISSDKLHSILKFEYDYKYDNDSIRTLQNYLKDIKMTFGIDIEEKKKYSLFNIKHEDISYQYLLSLALFILFHENLSWINYKPIIDNIENPLLYIFTIHKAINEKVILTFDYHVDTRNEWERNRKIKPLDFIIKESIWFLIGQDEDKIIKQFKFHKIQNIKLLKETFDIDNVYIEYNRKDFFQHSIGLFSSTENPEKVKIKVNKMRAEKVQSFPLTDDWKIEKLPDDEIIVEFTVSHPNDLSNWLFTLGYNAEILEPISYRNYYIKKLKNTLEIYNI